MNKKISDVLGVLLLGISVISMSSVREVRGEVPIRAMTEVFTEDVVVHTTVPATDSIEYAIKESPQIVHEGGLMVAMGDGFTYTQELFEKEYVSEEEASIEKNEVDVVTTNETEEAARNRWGIALTDQEKDMLAGIVWLEARGESVEGQEAVVEVVFNRMESPLFPNTLYEVLSQEHPVQFTSWKNLGIAQATEAQYDIIQNVLDGNTNILRSDTVYFSRGMETSNLDQKIGAHYFCY